jgi:hypothetical protein
VRDSKVGAKFAMKYLWAKILVHKRNSTDGFELQAVIGITLTYSRIFFEHEISSKTYFVTSAILRIIKLLSACLGQLTGVQSISTKINIFKIFIPLCPQKGTLKMFREILKRVIFNNKTVRAVTATNPT